MKLIKKKYLPKQLRHWCNLAGLYPETKRWGYHRSSITSGRTYYKGLGRRWRFFLVTPENKDDYSFDNYDMSKEIMFYIQNSDNYENFDRWANSVYKTEPFIEKFNEKNFIKMIKELSK